MRVNQLFYSPKFQSFLNTMSFVLCVCSFILTILLPLPYHNEKPGAISLEQNPDLAPPIIALCVVVPFLLGIIFFLLFKITYRKSLQEVKNEFQENVAFQLIDTDTTFEWEQQLEEFKLDKVKKKRELEIKQRAHFQHLKKLEEGLNEVKRIDTPTEEEDTI